MGARGRVHLHHADEVATQLNLRCDSISDVEAELAQAGIEARTWDESFGQLMQVPGPDGSWADVAEAQQALYGYEQLDAAGATGDVAACWHTADMAADVAAFAPYGFSPEGPVDEWWTSLRPAEDAGAIGLHKADGHAPSSQTGSCELTLTVDEDLDTLQARLEADGWATTRFSDEFISYVGVTDPDGVELQVHARS